MRTGGWTFARSAMMLGLVLGAGPAGHCLAQDSNATIRAEAVASLPVAGQLRAGQIAHYHESIQPILAEYCYGCHGDGASEGGMQLDGFADDQAMMADRDRWSKVLRNVRAGVMPPAGELRPTDNEMQALADWIKAGPFEIDSANIDPGRVTIHRLNRAEYRNTIFQLLGVIYDTDDAFPPDPSGLGLDNLAELLSVSPLMLEKYLNAAEAVLDGAFPSETQRDFVVLGDAIRGNNRATGERLSFNGAPEVTFTYRNVHPGTYRVTLHVEVVGLDAQADESGDEQTSEPVAEGEGTLEETPAAAADKECHFVASIQSGASAESILLERNFSGDSQHYEFVFDQQWSTEPHKFNFNVTDPNAVPEPRRRGFGFRRRNRPPPPPAPILKIHRLTITPSRPAASLRFFALDHPPEADDEFRAYVRRGITAFGSRAYRRPMDERTVDRLVAEVESAYSESGRFHDSLKPALAKILCSPRFLFRIDRTLPGGRDPRWGLIDEYSLASRLSYFLWSGMPDEELLRLAGDGQLRDNLEAQVLRMMSSEMSRNLVENFAGQWLQTRNVMSWPVVETAVLAREEIVPTEPWLTNSVRRAMRDETILFFARIVKENRSLLDFIDSDYTYLNEDLAWMYEIPDVTGSEMRLVKLAEDSVRGGVLTQGSMLLVTSHANRTSPVKRGLFVLDNILGLRPHDPPPDVPAIEDAAEESSDREPSFRELLELHRKDTLCASCHSLMDPIGLALDNFNAIGAYRKTEFGQTIDASGSLVTGEEFSDIRDLKQILKTTHRQNFYRCLTEKLMTYALGRGLEYHDTESVDRIVERLERENGRFSVLLTGIIESAPFQKQRIVSSAPRGGP